MIARLLIRLIRAYQRNVGGGRMNVDCNFTPSCSHYAVDAIERYGARTGTGLAIRRIARCNNRDLIGKIDDPVV